MKAPNIIEAVNDPNLFRPLFRDLETWEAWKAFLKALFALPMDDNELALYRKCTGRETPPQTPFREAWCPTGVRSGKSFVASLIACYLACFRDYREFLAPGERAMILVIAADRAQSQIIFRYVRAFLASNPMLSRLVEAERAESIDLANNVTIQVATCSFRSTRGFTAACVICDEIAFWLDKDFNPAQEVLRAIRPRLSTIPDSLLLAISSPYARSGPLWTTFRDHHGNDDSDVLCWQADSRTMNPTLSQALIDRDIALDPEAARSEWLAEFRSDLEGFLALEAIEAVVVQGRFELAPLPRAAYSAFVDPSGGRQDAAALAIAHREGEMVVIDLARKWNAPHSPQQVIKEMAGILKSYGIGKVTGDRYAGSWPSQEFLKHGVRYEPSAQDKSGLYLNFLPLVMSGKIELLNNQALFNELRNLERRTRSAGRDLVDHPPKGHDDLANAVAGAAVSAGGHKKLAGLLFGKRREPEQIPSRSQIRLARHRLGKKVYESLRQQPKGAAPPPRLPFSKE